MVHRDVHDTFRDETETLQLEAPETRESRELQRLAETFSVTYGKTHWQWKIIRILINLHHGKRFLFDIVGFCNLFWQLSLNN